jgi:hypothetical protein
MIDSWDLLREAAASVLHALGRPLPGYASLAQVQSLLAWAQALTASPRPHEADTGARVVSLVYTVYVAHLGWGLHLADPDPCIANAAMTNGCVSGAGTSSAAAPLDMCRERNVGQCVAFMQQQVAALEAGLAAAERDMAAACRRSFVQGPLMAARYVCEALPWDAITRDPAVVRSVSFVRRQAAASLLLCQCAAAIIAVVASLVSHRQERTGKRQWDTPEHRVCCAGAKCSCTGPAAAARAVCGCGAREPIPRRHAERRRRRRGAGRGRGGCRPRRL